MKNIKKITASVIITTLLLSSNTSLVNAEWIHSTEILHQSIPFLMSKEERNANKDKQLCKIASSFDILNDDGTLNYTYYPQGCQPKIDYENYDDGVDNFINDLFGESIIEKKADEDIKIDDEANNFIDSLFGNDLVSPEEKVTLPVEESVPVDTTVPTEDSINDADQLLKEIFGKTNTDSKISLKGKQIVSAIREFNSSKVRIRVGSIETNVLSDDMDYNSKVATLLRQVDNEFNIDSIKNDFAKNISKVSYSLSTYNNTNDLETKKVFRNKLVSDLKKLKKKYKILKKKDRIISKSLEKRGQL